MIHHLCVANISMVDQGSEHVVMQSCVLSIITYAPCKSGDYLSTYQVLIAVLWSSFLLI